MFSQAHGTQELAALSDGNATSCITGSTIDPLIPHLKLFFPWPNTSWDITFYPKYILKFKVTVESGVICGMKRNELWYDLQDYSTYPKVFVYASNSLQELDHRSKFEGTFKVCEVADEHFELASKNTICYFRCICWNARCNAAYLFLTNATRRVCEFTEYT